MSTPAQREAVARALCEHWQAAPKHWLDKADEMIAAYEAAAPKLAPKILALTERTIPELQAELGRIQMVLHAKVLGDPRDSVTIGPPKDPAP